MKPKYENHIVITRKYIKNILEKRGWVEKPYINPKFVLREYLTKFVQSDVVLNMDIMYGIIEYHGFKFILEGIEDFDKPFEELIESIHSFLFEFKL